MWHEGVSISGSMFENTNMLVADILYRNTDALYVIIIALSLSASLFLIDILRQSVEDLRQKSNYHCMMKANHQYQPQNLIEQIRSEVTPTGKILSVVIYAGLRKPLAITAIMLCAWLSYVLYLLRIDQILPKGFLLISNADRSFGDSDPDSL